MPRKLLKNITLPAKYWQRLVCLVFSIIVMGFSVAILLAVDMGSDSYATVNQGIVNYVPISFGTSEVLVNGTLLIFVFFADRKQINIGTLLNMFFVGYIVDFFSWVIGLAAPAGFFEITAVRYVFMVLGLVFFVLSVACYMAPELGVSAYDAIPVYLDKKWGKIPGRLIRIVWDLFFIAAGWLMGATVGIVTVLMAFMLGPVIAAVKGRLKKKWNY